MKDSITDVIERLRTLEAAATPGPWEVDMGIVIFNQYDRVVTSEANAQLIAEMRNTIVPLLDRLEKLEAAFEAAQQLLDCPYVIITEKAEYLEGNFEDALAALYRVEI